MDYGNMKFNEMERAALIENRKAICEWIHTNIVPKMPHDTKIEVGFGGTHGCGSHSTTPMYKLVVHSEPHKYYGDSSCGLKDEYIQIGLVEKFGRARNLENGYTSKSPYSILPIVDNWRSIKTETISKCSSLEAKYKNIFNFTV